MTLDQLLKDLADQVYHRFADNVAPSTIERMFRDEIGDREEMTLVPTRLLRAVVELSPFEKICLRCRRPPERCTCELGELRRLLEEENG